MTQETLDVGPPVVTFHEKPHRHYKVNGVKVPSVTKVIGATTDKSRPLKYWAQRETVAALDTLQAQYGADDGIFHDPARLEAAILAYGRELNAQSFVELYESQETTLPWGRPKDLLKLVQSSEESMQAKLERAAERGKAIHAALEAFADTGDPAALNPTSFRPEYRGYVRAIAGWLLEFKPVFHGSEIVVGSAKYRFGGRLDHHLTLNHPAYGLGLVDLKTNPKGRVYPVENFAQVEAYELAAIECGHAPTEFRAVLAVGPDGSYDFRRSTAEGADFVAALEWYRRQDRIEKSAKKGER